jgi:predicted amidohydrolase
MSSQHNRRSFLKASAVGAVSLSSGNAAASPAIVQAPDKVRISSIQTRKNPKQNMAQPNPFKPDFSMDNLYRWIDGWLDGYEAMFTQAHKDQCILSVVLEDFTHIAHTMMFLDDRSVFNDAVDYQTTRIENRLSEAARKNNLYLVACYFARENGKIYNVADLFSPSGDRVGRYRKVHIPQYEKWQVTAGDEFPAFETDIGWISMLICYDQMWPESAACCAMNGAQLICQPSAASLADYHMKARAHDNQVHMLSSTYHHSMISSPKAEILANAESKDPTIIHADVDLKNATVSPEYFYESLYSGIRDHKERHMKFRRPDAYKVLTQQKPPLASQYPTDNVANTPERISQVYQTVKNIRQGHPDFQHYHWNW